MFCIAPAQRVHRRPAVARLADFRLQQNVLPQSRRGEATPVPASCFTQSASVAVAGPPVNDHTSVAMLSRCMPVVWPEQPTRPVDDAVEGLVGGVVGGEHTDRLLDAVRVVSRRLLRRAVERRQVGIGVHLGQTDVGPVVARRVVDPVRWNGSVNGDSNRIVAPTMLPTDPFPRTA